MMLWLSDATRHEYGTSGGSWTDAGDPKGCLHTTEGGGWPSYDSGAKAPHATVMPIPGKGVEVRQHTPFDRAARALRNPAGGVQTNRDYVFQFELIGTCAKGGPGYYWPDADDAVLTDLFRKVIKPVSDAFHIPLIAPPWLAYPASFGNSRVRMSGSQFDHYTGWLGHQHVPENDHGDPGAFPWSRMIAAATPTVSQEDDMPTPEELVRADVVASPDPSETNPTWSMQTYLQAIYRNARAAYQQASAARAIAEAQAAKGGALTADEIEAAAKAGAKAALDEEITGATVNLQVQK